MDIDGRLALCARGECAPLIFDPDDVSSRSLTHQSFAKDADVNTIMRKFQVSGVLVDPRNVDSQRIPRFGDFSDIPDYARIVERIGQAQADFMTLAPEVRARFQNDVAMLLDFIADPSNAKEAVGLGLLPESVLPVVDAVVGAMPKASPTVPPAGSAGDPSAPGK